MLRVALAAILFASTVPATAQSASAPSNSGQPGAPMPGVAVWPADNAATAPVPPTFVPNLGGSPNGDALNRAPRVVRVSGGVMASQLVRRVQPVYPSLGTSSNGAVVLATRVGRDGRVKGVSVISGPPELQKATVDAVKQWIYKPYLLNGEPVAVEFTVALFASR